MFWPNAGLDRGRLVDGTNVNIVNDGDGEVNKEELAGEGSEDVIEKDRKYEASNKVGNFVNSDARVSHCVIPTLRFFNVLQSRAWRPTVDCLRTSAVGA